MFLVILNNGWLTCTRHTEEGAEEISKILKEEFPSGKVEIKKFGYGIDYGKTKKVSCFLEVVYDK